MRIVTDKYYTLINTLCNYRYLNFIKSIVIHFLDNRSQIYRGSNCCLGNDESKSSSKDCSPSMILQFHKKNLYNCLLLL